MIFDNHDCVTGYGIYDIRSPSIGTDGQMVEDVVASARAKACASIAQHGTQISSLASLSEIVGDASNENWDGEGGLPVCAKAVARTAHLISMMPNDWPAPDIGVDPDGEISLSWTTGRRRTVSVSIGPESKIAMAWIIDGEKAYGADSFTTELPVLLTAQVDRILSQ